MRLSRRSLLSASTTLLLAGALAACGGDAGSASGGAFDSIEITGEPTSAPTVSVDEGFQAESFTSRVISEGDGQPLQDGDQVIFEQYQVNESGEVVLNSYESGGRGSMPVDEAQIGADYYSVFSGVPLGSRVAFAYPQQDQQSGETTSQLVVLDLIDLMPKRAAGAEQAPDPDFPQISLAEDGAPSLESVPEGLATPDTTQVTTTILGDGAPVEEGQYVYTHYSLWTLEDWQGEPADSSWERGQPFPYTALNGEVIQGWDEAVVGQNVGSQIIAVVPPDEGYGASAEHPLATNTLIFVIDILYAM